MSRIHPFNFRIGMNRYLDWLQQAENDLLWAEHSLTGEFFSQTCFIVEATRALASAQEIHRISKQRLIP